MVLNCCWGTCAATGCYGVSRRCSLCSIVRDRDGRRSLFSVSELIVVRAEVWAGCSITLEKSLLRLMTLISFIDLFETLPTKLFCEEGGFYPGATCEVAH
jgi:hypothetical protein